MTVIAAESPGRAIRYCREVTKRRARNFYYGLRLLPEPQRSALFTVYAWMRRADDLVDGAGVELADVRDQLDAFSRATEAALAGHTEGDDPVLIGLRESAVRFPLTMEPFRAMLDGQLDDLAGRRYESFETLREYCEHVASSVGLICITIWGYDDERAPALAVDRGIAFQLTNILRDFVEDADAGRLYLPAEDLRRHGLTPEALRAWTDPAAGERFLLEQITRAESFYRRSAPLDAMITPGCRPTLWAMTRIYRGLLAQMATHPVRLVRGPRIRLTAMNKGTIALTARLRRGRGENPPAVRRRVAIIGGGVAGIAAALRLAEADCEPIVIETSRRLGGRATSFVDPRTGVVLDNCQHVVLGCCTNVIDLHDRLGVADRIEWHRALYWTKGRGIVDRVRASRLPALLHLAGSMRRMRMFDAGEKRAIRRAMRRIVRLGAKGRLAWRDRTFAEFLASCDQPASVVRSFWSTIIVSACNLDVGRVAAAAALKVFQEGFLGNRWSYTMGLSAVPLLDLYDPAVPAIEAAGGAVRLGEAARAIAFDGRRVTGVVTSRGLIEATAVVSAVPFDRLAKLVSDTMRGADRRLQSLDAIDVSPILGVHLRFDQTIMEWPHLVLVDKGVDWLFNKGVDEDGRQHLHAVVSCAEAWMALEEEEIVRRVLRDVHDVLPGSKGLAPVDARAVKEKRATFAATPDVEPRRPAVEPEYVGVGGGGIENLYLAGDWCDNGWPATMEGAVRTGYTAAAAITGQGGVVEDVPSGWLARLLGL